MKVIPRINYSILICPSYILDRNGNFVNNSGLWRITCSRPGEEWMEQEERFVVDGLRGRRRVFLYLISCDNNNYELTRDGLQKSRIFLNIDLIIIC